MTKREYDYLEKIKVIIETKELDDHSKLFFITQVMLNWSMETPDGA